VLITRLEELCSEDLTKAGLSLTIEELKYAMRSKYSDIIFFLVLVWLELHSCLLRSFVSRVHESFLQHCLTIRCDKVLVAFNHFLSLYRFIILWQTIIFFLLISNVMILYTSFVQKKQHVGYDNVSTTVDSAALPIDTI
jgi:hypothetical protein